MVNNDPYPFSSITLGAVRFVQYKNFINPSRISLLDVNIHYTTHDCKCSVLQCNMQTAICLSTILTEHESFLVKPMIYGLKNKYIAGHFHSQEWQRFEGFVTMVFDNPVMTAQLYNRAISFATMGAAKGAVTFFFFHFDSAFLISCTCALLQQITIPLTHLRDLGIRQSFLQSLIRAGQVNNPGRSLLIPHSRVS